MTNIYIAYRKTKRRAKPKTKVNTLELKLPNFKATLFGFLLGVFFSCLFVYIFSANEIILKIPAKDNKKPLIVGATKPITPIVEEPRFDFYTELANTESPTLDLKIPIKAINGYIVEAGSFSNMATADAIRAKLTLNGYSAKITTSKQASGETKYKILLGTFTQEQKAKALQQKLKELDIDSTLVLKYEN